MKAWQLWHSDGPKLVCNSQIIMFFCILQTPYYIYPTSCWFCPVKWFLLLMIVWLFTVPTSGVDGLTFSSSVIFWKSIVLAVIVFSLISCQCFLNENLTSIFTLRHIFSMEWGIPVQGDVSGYPGPITHFYPCWLQFSVLRSSCPIRWAAAFLSSVSVIRPDRL